MHTSAIELGLSRERTASKNRAIVMNWIDCDLMGFRLNEAHTIVVDIGP